MTQEELAKEIREAELNAQRLRRQLDEQKRQERLALEKVEEEKRKKAGFNLSTSDDYAVLEMGGFEFYFGYEYKHEMKIKDEDFEEWGFVVRKITGKTTYSNVCSEPIYNKLQSEMIEPRNSEDMDAWLLAGIAGMVNEGLIEIKLG